MKSFLAKAFKYCLVGGFASIVDFGLYYIFATYVFSQTTDSLFLAFSTTIGFVGGLIVNYFLSIFFVWRVGTTERTGKTAFDIILFVLIGIGGLIISIGTVWVLNDCLRLHYALSKLIAMALSLIWNFLARNFFIFNKECDKSV